MCSVWNGKSIANIFVNVNKGYMLQCSKSDKTVAIFYKRVFRAALLKISIIYFYLIYIIPIIINDAPMYIRTRFEITFSAFSFPLYIFTAIRKIMANIHHSANMHLRIFFFFTSIFLLSFMINNALFYCQIIRS